MVFCFNSTNLLRYLLKKSFQYPHFTDENILIFGEPLFTPQQSDQTGENSGNEMPGKGH